MKKSIYVGEILEYTVICQKMDKRGKEGPELVLRWEDWACILQMSLQ